MQEQLRTLGFSEKEAAAYCALLELGTQAASVIAKKTGFPKATVLFLFDNLCRRGYVRKSRKGRAQYFFADPDDLEAAKRAEIEIQENTLKKTVPLLKELKNPFTSPPKLTFFEGLDGCRKAYSLLLESTTEIFEFGAHNDLLKLGRDFMRDFIRTRVKHGIMLHAICKKNPMNNDLHGRDAKERRRISLYPEKIGELYSSIVTFEDKTLLVNLYHDAFAILIQNREVAETLKTIYKLARGKK